MAKKEVVTIKDVAREAGVSVATASRALGGYGYVSKEAKSRVLEAARKLGYNHNLVAKSLRTRKTYTLGYLLPDIANPFYAGIARGIQDVAFEQGYSVIICNNDNDITKTERFLKMFIRNRVEGIIYSAPFNQALKEMVETAIANGIPVVNCYGSTRIAALDVVTGDAEGGCYKAVRHLLELGHRKIGFLKVRGSGISKRRFAGCKRALEEAGVEIFPELIVEVSDYSQASGYLGAKMLFARKELPTAVFAFSEQLAIGVLKAARENSISIPEKLSLIGVDDVIGEVLEPPLTSVKIPTYEAGKAAATLLLERIEKQIEEGSREVVLEEKLVVRESTKACRY
ncbi:LacI family DNA-binding transcriptional regulator [Atrimonas thermophila]|uniref:LacI family DNA-binding transcriptional regulator n=1 Tax=Atrimonas thermophila TaxID=3064161 RepID=UPI00399C62B7